MKIALSIILIHISVNAFGQHENWEFYMADYDGKPGSILLDMNLKKIAPDKQCPFCVRTGPAIANCNVQGFPADSASLAELIKILDYADSCMYKVNAIPAGTFMMNCRRENYYYVTDTIGLRKELTAMYQSHFPNAEWVVAIKEDRSWKTYLEFLYPNELSYEWMQNSKVAAPFIREGDDLMREKQLDHILYFKTQVGCNRFIKEYVLPLGYSVVMQDRSPKNGFSCRLQIRKSDYIDLNHITTITYGFRKEAEKYSGFYHGWEAFLIKEK